MFWTVPLFWWGYRLTRLGVDATTSGLTVRNQVRTHNFAWSDIRDVRLEKRRGSRWQRAALFFLEFDRRIGVIEVHGREDLLEIHATESFWFGPWGRLFSQSPAASAEKVERIRQAWLADGSR